MPPRRRLGERLRRRREELGLSHEALAEAVDVSVRGVVRWEHDEAAPHPEHRRRLARALGIDVRDLAPTQEAALGPLGPGARFDSEDGDSGFGTGRS